MEREVEVEVHLDSGSEGRTSENAEKASEDQSTNEDEEESSGEDKSTNEDEESSGEDWSAHEDDVQQTVCIVGWMPMTHAQRKCGRSVL
jgi:hypothetical protein